MSTIEKIKALRKLAEKINPTIIYNEGWMVRLLVEESIRTEIKVQDIDFSKIKEWTSEAQISSPFEGADLKENTQNERKTHADIILGDFLIAYKSNTAISIEKETPPKILGIIEAKMGSALSPGVKNTKSKNYNQASRSVCCLAHVTKESPECEIFFAVVAPKKKIDDTKLKFKDKMSKINTGIEERFNEVENREYSVKMKNKVNNCKRLIITFEEWIKKIKDKDVEKELKEFYDECIFYNIERSLSKNKSISK